MSRETILDSSRKALAYYLENSDSSYSYTVKKGSLFGDGQETQLTFRNGIPVERRFQSYRPSEACSSHWEVTEAYIETENIDSHAKGDSVKTLEKLYEACATYLKVDSVSNWIYLELDSNHVIRSCGYTPRNCADDCFRGFTFSGLSWNDSLVNDTDIVGIYRELRPGEPGMIAIGGVRNSFQFTTDSFYLAQSNSTDLFYCDTSGQCSPTFWTHFYRGSYKINNRTSIALSGNYDSTVGYIPVYPLGSGPGHDSTFYSFGSLSPGNVLGGEYPYSLIGDTLRIFNPNNRNSNLPGIPDTLRLVLKP